MVDNFESQLTLFKKRGEKNKDREFYNLFHHPVGLTGLPGARRDGGIHLYWLNLASSLV